MGILQCSSIHQHSSTLLYRAYWCLLFAPYTAPLSTIVPTYYSILSVSILLFGACCILFAVFAILYWAYCSLMLAVYCILFAPYYTEHIALCCLLFAPDTTGQSAVWLLLSTERSYVTFHHTLQSAWVYWYLVAFKHCSNTVSYSTDVLIYISGNCNASKCTIVCTS